MSLSTGCCFGRPLLRSSSVSATEAPGETGALSGGASITVGPDLYTKMGGACTKQSHVAPGPLAEARIDGPAVAVAQAGGTSGGEAGGAAGDDGTSRYASTSAQQACEFMAEETRIDGPSVAVAQAGGTSGGEAGGAAGGNGTSTSVQQASGGNLPPHTKRIVGMLWACCWQGLDGP